MTEEPVREMSEASLEGVCVKSEDSCEDARVKDEPSWSDVYVKEESSWPETEGACGVSEAAAAAGLYAGHAVKDELVFGPELVEPPCALRADQAQGLEESRYQHFVKDNRGKKLRYGCTLCAFESNELPQLISHVPKEHLAMISCPSCGLISKDLQFLEEHKALPHPDPIYSCESCKLNFPNHKKLCTHKKHQHSQLNCSFCREFVLKADFRKHLREKHEDVMPTCSVCGLKAISNFQLRQHQRIVHMKEKNVQCSVCEYKCFGPMKLRNHMISHKVVKLYECRYCAKKFPRPGTWRLHEMIHTGEKNKVCKICDASFVQKASLNYHMMKHHPDNV